MSEQFKEGNVCKWPDCGGSCQLGNEPEDCAECGTTLSDADYLHRMAAMSERDVGHTPEGREHARRLRDVAKRLSEGTPRWIPVSERLPEFPESSIKSSGNSVKVIVFTGYFVTALDYARNVYAKTAKGQAPRFEWEGRISPWPVTHWMPLPEGPSK